MCSKSPKIEYVYVPMQEEEEEEEAIAPQKQAQIRANRPQALGALAGRSSSTTRGLTNTANRQVQGLSSAGTAAKQLLGQ